MAIFWVPYLGGIWIWTCMLKMAGLGWDDVFFRVKGYMERREEPVLHREDWAAFALSRGGWWAVGLRLGGGVLEGGNGGGWGMGGPG